MRHEQREWWANQRIKQAKANSGIANKGSLKALSVQPRGAGLYMQASLTDLRMPVRGPYCGPNSTRNVHSPVVGVLSRQRLRLL